MATFGKATFSAVSYAAFRPTYPPSLYQAVLSYHRGPRNLCIDLGCGTGIVSRALAPSFKSMIGTDPSQGMLNQAQHSNANNEHPNITFRQAPAEKMPFIQASSVDMVTAGQSAHWFEYAKFFKELGRVMRPGGTMACWGYKDPVLVDYPKATRILDHYAYGETKDLLGPYWSQPGRSYVQNHLRVIQPPPGEWDDVQRIEYEPGTAGKDSGEGTKFMSWRLKVGDVKEYYRTWSSYHGWKEAHEGMMARIRGGQGDLMDLMFDEMAQHEPELGRDEHEVEMEWGSALVMARRKK